MLVRDADGLARFIRDPDAETAAMGCLLHADLVPLIEFEDVEPTPRQDWDHAPAMPVAASIPPLIGPGTANYVPICSQ